MAAVRVRSHVRNGHRVRGYARTGRSRALSRSRAIPPGAGAALSLFSPSTPFRMTGKKPLTVKAAPHSTKRGPKMFQGSGLTSHQIHHYQHQLRHAHLVSFEERKRHPHRKEHLTRKQRNAELNLEAAGMRMWLDMGRNPTKPERRG